MDVSLLNRTKPLEPPAGLCDHSLRTIWHESAPDAVRKAYRSGKHSKGWSAWRKHLARRSRPFGLSDLLPGKTSPLAWILPDGVEVGRILDLLEQLDRLGSKGPPAPPSLERTAIGWLADAAAECRWRCAGAAAEHGQDAAGTHAGYALEALAWGHALPRLAKSLPPEVWWDLLGRLFEAVADSDGVELDEAPLVHQMLAGELPLTLWHLFPEIAPCRKLGRAARRALSAGLVDLLDGEGLPRAEHLGMLRPLLACWTRCRALSRESAKKCWTGAAQTQYEWLVRNALRLSRLDGTHVFSCGPSGAWSEGLFDAAVRFSGDDDDRQIAALVLPGRKKADTPRTSKLALPEVATHSEWSAVAVLRPNWKPAGPRLVVTYPGESVRIELECGREVLWTGTWELEVSRDGERMRPDASWEEVCWVSDDDVDYLELEIALQGGLRVERHLLLAREDQILLLADAILGDRPANLEYRACLPLADGISFQPADESREGFLAGRRRLALALPLALAEWRGDSHAGSLDQSGRGLELCQRARARSMFAPLFFDLRPRRMTRPLTWRQLTVAENLAIQPPDVAVGYRVVVGKGQWLIFRSLAPAANRTLLGHNLATEMLVARFDRHGEVHPLLEIES